MDFILDRRKVILYLFLLFYLLLVTLDLKSIIGFNSSDELLFTNFLNKKQEYYSLGHFVWGNYITKTFQIHEFLPIYLNVILLFYCFKQFYEKAKLNGLMLMLVLTLPSILFFSCTYLRDIPIMSFILLIISKLCVIPKTWRSYVLIVMCTLIVILLRPYLGVFVILSLILSVKWVTKFKLYRIFPIAFFLVGIVMYYSPQLLNMYKATVYSVEPNLVNFGLLGFDKEGLDNVEVILTFYFNWIPYWCTYNLMTIDSFIKLVFVYDTYLITLLIAIVFIKFNKNIFKMNWAYRFCLYMLLSSFILGSLESGSATIMRHKLVFVPCVLYLFASTNRLVIK